MSLPDHKLTTQAQAQVPSSWACDVRNHSPSRYPLSRVENPGNIDGISCGGVYVDVALIIAVGMTSK